MVWGFYPKVNLKKKIEPSQREEVLEILEKNFKNKKYKISSCSAYTIGGRSRNFFRYYQSIHVYVRIDEEGNFNLEAEMANTFYDYGLLNKHVTQLTKSINFIN